MTPLANKHKAVNLGQGFPNTSPPDFALECLKEVMSECHAVPTNQQYARTQGDMELVTEVKKMYATLLNWPDIADENVLVTNGTTQGLNLAFQALLNPGDEVIVFEPYYDAYVCDVQLAGGVVRYVTLIPGDTGSADSWVFTEEQLRSAITSRTKVILINTPQNVPGKTWLRHELELVARVAVEHNLFIVSDEVYMALVFPTPHPAVTEKHTHICIASLPGMRERCLTLCSAGKTFSCTGWKIGWAVGPSWIIQNLSRLSLYQTFSVATPLQIAVARTLRAAEGKNFYNKFVEEYEHRRQLLCDILAENSLPPVIPSGTFFVLADISRVDPRHYYDPNDKDTGRDWQFCRWLTKVIGVCAIPVTPFCCIESRPTYDRFVRFAFCKTVADIKEASVRLRRLKDYLLPPDV
ncbi:kynurenine aminotransferase [Trypanosoma vivax]|nr:kynurenine aminotransferase [Trypanosoma vivax]